MKTLIIVLIIISVLIVAGAITTGIYFGTKPRGHSKGSSKGSSQGSSKGSSQGSSKGSSPVDCELTEWTTCDNNCKGGKQTRSVTRDAANGGEACGPLSRSCNTPHPCPIDCIVSDGPCDVSCSSKTETPNPKSGLLQRTILTPAAYGGKTCPSPLISDCTNTPAPCTRPTKKFEESQCWLNGDCTALAEQWYAFDPQPYRKKYICNGDTTYKCSYDRPFPYTKRCIDECTNCGDNNAYCSSL